MKFGTYDTQPRVHPIGGRQYVIDFPNGYGASIICGYRSFHCDDDTYEVAVTKHGSLCYTTPIADDVLGYQTDDDVAHLLAAIERLPTARTLEERVTWEPVGGKVAVLMVDDRPVGHVRATRFRTVAYINLFGKERKFTGKDAMRDARWAVLADMRGPL